MQLTGGSGLRDPQKFEIGTRGAQALLESPWVRKEITKDVGKDQFIAKQDGWLSGKRTVYAIANEIEGPLENEADYRFAMDNSCTLGHEVKIEIATLENGVVRATRAFDEAIDGTSCSFRCELLVKDGLGYHFMVWSLASQARTMKARVNQIVQNFSFPGPDTEHGKGAVPVTRSVSVAGHVVEYALRPSVMKMVEPSYGVLAEHQSLDEAQRLDVAVASFRRTASDGRIAAMLDSERRQLARSVDSFVESSRGEVDVNGVRCGFLLGTRDGYAVKSLCVPIGEDSGVAFRWHSSRGVDAARPERDACFASIRVKQADAGFLLPKVPEPPTYEDRSALSSFLEKGSRALPPLPMWSANVQKNGNSWIAHNWSEVVVEDRGDWITRYDDGQSIHSAAIAGGEVYVLENGVVRRVDKDGAIALPRKSDRAVACIASGGDSLIALCSAAPVLGMGRSAAPLVVVRLASDGAETDLGEVGCTSCEYAAWHKERNELLVASFAYSSGPSLRPNGQGQELWSKKLDGGASESWGRWDVVHAIVAAADGFLVSGQPEDGVDGVHLVRGPKERELLLAASTQLLTAVAFDGAQLTVVSPRSGSATLIQLPVEVCREDGLLCQPFSRRSIEAIGNALVEELKDRAPNTKDDVIAARDRANAIARAGHGAPLPNQAADVEALVTAMGFARGLSENGRVLCAILVAATAIDAGGEWVPAPKASWSPWRSRGAVVTDSALCVYCQPTMQVVSALDDSEGSMSLVMDVESRNGRALLVGVDADALRARSDALIPSGLEQAITACDREALAGILASNAAANDVRSYVYAALASRGRFDMVEALAAPFASVETAVDTDCLAWIAARSQSAKSEQELRDLCDRALSALRRFPRNAELCVLLGRACERAYPQEPQRARACYERALELGQYGDAAEAARKALAK